MIFKCVNGHLFRGIIKGGKLPNCPECGTSEVEVLEW